MPPAVPSHHGLPLALLLAMSPLLVEAATDAELRRAGQATDSQRPSTSASKTLLTTAHFPLEDSSIWNSERETLWENISTATNSTGPAADAFQLSPTVGNHSVSVHGSGAVTRHGSEGWKLGLSASEDADHRIDPEAAQSAALDAFTLERSYNDRGFVRLGRYQAQHFTAVGRLDGLQGELRLRENVSGGVMAGFRSHSSSELEAAEPVAVAYLRTKLHDSDRLDYNSTVGLLGSAYNGDMDRAALLVEQQATVAGKLGLQASTEIDLDVFSDLEQHVAPLTRLRLSGTLPVSSALTLRAGLRRDRRPDTRAERAMYGGSEEEYTEGTWTHWAGATTQLPLGFALGGEVAVRDGIADEDNGTDGTLSLSRHGLPFLPRASTRASVYTQGVGDARATAARLTTESLLVRRPRLATALRHRLYGRATRFESSRRRSRSPCPVEPSSCLARRPGSELSHGRHRQGRSPDRSRLPADLVSSI